MIASLVSPFMHRLRKNVDVLIFNPPYVPTSVDEADDAQGARGIAGAWAGGQDGMRVTDVLLGMLDVRPVLPVPKGVSERATGSSRTGGTLLSRRAEAERHSRDNEALARGTAHGLQSACVADTPARG